MNLESLRAKWPLGIGAAIAFIGLLLVFAHDLTLPMRSSPEAQAVGRLLDISHRQEDFRAQRGCFAREIAEFAEITNRDHDYSYAIVPGTANDQSCLSKYTVTASPVSTKVKGARFFSIDDAGVVRFDKTHPTNSESPILK